MKLKIKELNALCRNMEPNEYLRGRIGTALCGLLYDPADEDEYEGEYKELNEAWFYNCPSEEDIFKCLDLLEETGSSEVVVELDVL